MLFRVGLGVGALGIGAIAYSIGDVHLGISLDGNQVGLLVGGALILLGAAASAGVLRHAKAETPVIDERVAEPAESSA
jgi:hypothetical protein